MQNKTVAITQIARLLSAFPPTSNQDPDALAQRYIEAVSEQEPRDIENAVTRYITAKVPDFDGRFAPTPTMLALQCQHAARRRLEAWAAEEHSRRAIEAPKEPEWVEPSPEQRAARKQQLDELAAQLGADMRSDEAEIALQRQERQLRTNARFKPDTSSRAMAKRLGLSIVFPDTDYDEGR